MEVVFTLTIVKSYSYLILAQRDPFYAGVRLLELEGTCLCVIKEIVAIVLPSEWVCVTAARVHDGQAVLSSLEGSADDDGVGNHVNWDQVRAVEVVPYKVFSNASRDHHCERT